MAASKLMMRPVILSRPENSAPLLAIFCDGGSGITSSPGCGEVSVGCGVPRSGRPPGPTGSGGCPGGPTAAEELPGGGGSGCDCTPASCCPGPGYGGLG